MLAFKRKLSWLLFDYCFNILNGFFCFVLTDEQGIFLVQKMPGPLSQSEADSSEENAHLAIHNMIEDEVNMAFEKMLDDLNLSEEKKEPLRLQSVVRKKEMLAMHVKGAFKVINLEFFFKL